MDKKVTVWSFPSIMFICSLSGLFGGYLIVWQTLRRMGKEKEARNFLIFGGIIALLIYLVSFWVIRTINGIGEFSSLSLGFIFPIWLYAMYYNKWEQNNFGKTGSNWSLIIWGFMGFILWMIFIRVLSFSIDLLQTFL